MITLQSRVKATTKEKTKRSDNMPFWNLFSLALSTTYICSPPKLPTERKTKCTKTRNLEAAGAFFACNVLHQQIILDKHKTVLIKCQCQSFLVRNLDIEYYRTTEKRSSIIAPA